MIKYYLNPKTKFTIFYKKYLCLENSFWGGLILSVILFLLYVCSTNTVYHSLYETGNVISYNTYIKTERYSNTDTYIKYTLLKYSVIRKNKKYTYTVSIPENCSDICLKVKSNNPKVLKKYKTYINYINLFCINSSTEQGPDKYIIE